MPTSCNSYKIPIMLGVTGHRNVVKSQYPEIKDLVTRFIKERVFEKYPSSPVKLLTPLADGADRLVAEIAIECGIPIIVPLPMPADVYLTTFAGADGSPEREESAAQFNRLLAAAESSFVLPLVEGVSEQGLLESGEQRESQYALVGAYMAKHSHILIALYDGLPSEAIGGTAQVVRYRESGEMNGLPLKISGAVEAEKLDFLKPDSFFDLQNSGIVWRVQVDRATSGQPRNTVGMTEEYTEDKNHLVSFTAALRKINQFNFDVDEYLSSGTPQGEMFQKDSVELRQLQREILEADAGATGCLDRIRDVFRAADHLSIMYSNEHKSYFAVFCAMVLGITFAELSYAHGWYPVVALVLYFLFLSAGYGAYEKHKERSVQSKYNEYRSLAEALRVQFFWRCAGLRSMVPDHYLNKHQGDMFWISSAIKGIAFNNYLKGQQNVQFVIDTWIEEQAEFYEDREVKLIKAEKRQENFSNALYCSMFIVSLCGIFLHEEIEHYVVSTLLGIIPIGFILVEHKFNFNAELEKIRSYKIYLNLFARAKAKIHHYHRQGNFDPTKGQEIIYQLGCESLIENGDWLIVNRDKKAGAAKP